MRAAQRRRAIIRAVREILFLTVWPTNEIGARFAINFVPFMRMNLTPLAPRSAHRLVLVPALVVLSMLAGAFAAQADTPLEISMQHIKKAYKELSIDLQAPQEASKPDYLNLTASLKTEAQTARGEVPKIANGMTPDQKAAMIQAYQKSMDDFAASIDALAQSIQQSQWDAARKQVATLKQEMVDGHKKFRKKE
jgi:soluble cytochrome b562